MVVPAGPIGNKSSFINSGNGMTSKTQSIACDNDGLTGA